MIELRKLHDYLQSPVSLALLACLLLLAITICVYAPSLNNSFIFDDEPVIVKNAFIKDISLTPELFKTDIFYFSHSQNPLMSRYYRPLQALSYSIDYFFWKLNPAGYRMVNIVIHALNAMLIFFLICLIFKDKMLGFLSALIFCVHPIQVSDVSFISVRAVPMAVFFMLISIVLSHRYFFYKKRKWLFLSICSYAFALLSWEMSLLLPAFFILFAVFSGIDKKRILLSLIPFILLTLGYFVFRGQFLTCDKLGLAGIFSIKSLKGFSYYFFDYFNQLILPVASRKSLLGVSILLNSVFLFFSFCALAFFLIRAFIFKDKIASFGLIFYSLGMLPMARLWEMIPVYGSVVAEHYCYIASIGFFILISWLILKLRRYLGRFAYALIIAIACFYAALTVVNSKNYKDDITFYNYLVNLDNGHTFFRVNLGNAYYKNKMYEAAEKEAMLVLAAEPSAWEAYLLLGNVFKDSGSQEKAVESYKKALTLYPNSSVVLNNLALIFNAQGKYKDAVLLLKKALKADPGSSLVLRNFTYFLIKDKLYNQAMQNCEKLLKLNPRDIQAHIMLGIIFAETGNLDEAENYFNKALRYAPDSFDALKNLGVLYANRGDLDRAIAAWEKAEALDPINKEIINDLKVARKLKGQGVTGGERNE